jgi:hypothetical protein
MPTSATTRAMNGMKINFHMGGSWMFLGGGRLDLGLPCLSRGFLSSSFMMCAVHATRFRACAPAQLRATCLVWTVRTTKFLNLARRISPVPNCELASNYGIPEVERTNLIARGISCYGFLCGRSPNEPKIELPDCVFIDGPIR